MKTAYQLAAVQFAAALLLVVASSAIAQEPAPATPSFAPPTPVVLPEHAFLKKFVGEWTSVTECQFGPEVPAMTMKGKMSSRMLGDFWVVSETDCGDAEMRMKAIQTIGYDAEKKKYVGTWVDSAINHMWKYEGSVDSTGKILALEAEGPNFAAPGTTAKFQDSYEFKSDDEVIIRSKMQTEDGKWVTFMTGTAKRVK